MRRARRTENGMVWLVMIVLMSFALFASMMSGVQGTDVSRVERSVLYDPAPGAEFEVTLTMDGEPPLVVGIRETIPAGFSFVSTTCENHKVYGQEIAFVVMDEITVSYRVTAPASGTGTFTGTWFDLLGELQGDIEATTVVVGGGGTPSTPAQPVDSTETPSTEPEPMVPGFKALSLVGSLVILLLLMGKRLTGGKPE